MDLIQFLVEIILQSFTEAQIWKKQPFYQACSDESLFIICVIH